MPMLTVQKIARLTGHNASVFALAGDANAQHFLSAAGDGWVVRWDLQQPEIGKVLAKVDTQIFSLLNLPDLNKLVIGNMNGGLHWLDLNNSDLNKNIAHHQKGVFDILHMGESVFTLGGEGRITRWSAAEGRSLESLHLTNQSLRTADYDKTCDEIAVGTSDNSIYILDVNVLEIKKNIQNAHNNSVFTTKYSPDGHYLLSGGRDAHLKIWDAANDFKLLSSQPAHWFTINDIAFSTDGQYFATASRDKTIKIWDAHTFQLLKVIDTIRHGGHLNSVNCLLWLDDYLISGSDDRSIMVWLIS